MRTAKLTRQTQELSLSCRINTQSSPPVGTACRSRRECATSYLPASLEWGGRVEFAVAGAHWDAEAQTYILSEVVHNRSEAIKLRNSLNAMLKATAPPPKRKAR